MKKIIITLAMMGFLYSLSAAMIKTSNLVGGWRFEGNANDWSGNGNSGTVINGAILTTGKFGQAYNFDGVNDYVLINNSSASGHILDLRAAPRPSALGQSQVASMEHLLLSAMGRRYNTNFLLLLMERVMTFLINGEIVLALLMLGLPVELKHLITRGTTTRLPLGQMR